MALFLTCNCSPDASLCNLTALVWKLRIRLTQVGAYGASWWVTLFGEDISVQLIGYGTGEYSIDLTPMGDYVAAWEGLQVQLFGDASLNSGDPMLQQKYAVDYIIEQHYQCVNLTTGDTTNKVVPARTRIRGTYVECRTGDTLRAFVVGGSSSLSGAFFKSSPLGDCFSGGINTENSNFQPPLTPTKVDVDNSGNVCLCATGGTGDYLYTVVAGNLACGQSLNGSSGCIEGDPDGSCPASDEVTFRVTDLGGGSIDGGMATTGGACIVRGTQVNVAVNPFTGAQDGSDFQPGMVGQFIRIAAMGTVLESEVMAFESTTFVIIADDLGDLGNLSPVYEPVGWACDYPLPDRTIGGAPTVVVLSGTCRTFGYGVTRLSGNDFDLVVMAGGSITLHGIVYGIASVDDEDHITLTTTAPVDDPTSWSFSYEIPGEGPHVPETAEVTCGLTGTGCDGSGTTHNFFH